MKTVSKKLTTIRESNRTTRRSTEANFLIQITKCKEIKERLKPHLNEMNWMSKALKKNVQLISKKA